MDEGELVYLGEHAVSTGADGKSQYVGNAELKKIQGYFGLVFQNFNLFPHYSVLKNLMDAPVHVQKRNKEEVKKEAMELLEKMTCNPAKLYKLPGGSIQVHAPADFVIFNPDETWTVTDFASKSSNSPFKGAELYGKIHYTICNGKIVYQG